MPLSYECIVNSSDEPCIRLLHLRPSQDVKDGIETDLEVVMLKRSPKFEALSYVWGNAKKTVAIKCGGATFNATANLFSALGHLRHPDHTRVLWVDAICINQDDNAEKSHQVNIMGSIYRRAERVLIWLGPSAEQSDVAFRYIERVFAQLKRCSPSALRRYAEDEDYNARAVDFPSILRKLAEEGPFINQDSSDSAQAHISGSHDSAVEIADLTEEEEYAFSALIKRRWWTRVWIIQELCLTSEAVVVCGNSSVSWEAFSFGVAHAYGDEDGMVVQEMVNYHTLACTRLKLSQPGVQLDFLDAISVFRWFQATDPRDKVYSLLGITGNVGILPDYTANVESCYKTTARAIISNSETLDVLDFVVPPPSFQWTKMKREKMPSWVPDWSYDETSIRHGFTSPSVSDFVSGPNNMGELPVELGLPLLESQARFDGENILFLKGIEIDKIEALEDIIQMPHPFDQISLKILYGNRHGILSEGLRYIKLGWWFVVTLYRLGDFLYFFERLMAFAERASPEPEEQNTNDRLHSVARLLSVLMRDIVIEDTDDIETAAETMLKPWDLITRTSIYRIFQCLSLQKIFPFLYKYLFAFLAIYYYEDSDDLGLEILGLLSLSVGQCPALTQNGRLCLTPHTCRVGDRVTLLRGGRHPYIVRPKSERLELVGPCYVSRSHMEEMRQEWRDVNSRDMAFE